MALPTFGTNTTLDTLASSYQTVIEFGEDRAWDAISEQMNAHNETMREIMTEFAGWTTDRLRRYGTTAKMKMQELDEFGTADTQKAKAGDVVGFPLSLYGESLQWTYRSLLVMTGAQLAAQFQLALDADIELMRQLMVRALVRATNYTTEDRLVDHQESIPIPVKALINADGSGMPIGPNGEEYDGSTHTHLLAVDWAAANAAQKEAALTGALETVLEHFRGVEVRMVISRSDEAKITSQAGAGFDAYLPAQIVPALGARFATGNVIDETDLYNRAIGRYKGAEVWVKPWGIPGYVLIYVRGGTTPILAIRERSAGFGDFKLAFEDESHPLRCRGYEREVGVSVWNRVAGSILYLGGAAYAVPTIQ